MSLPHHDRRGFIKKSVLASLASVLGTELVFAGSMPAGYTPLVLSALEGELPTGKHKDLIIRSDRPWNVETPAHLLDDAITPADKMFIRNNGALPTDIDIKNWTLTIDGESVNSKKTFTLQDLKTNFKHYTYQLTLECAGNGRSGFNPPTSGNQWAEGAVSCAEWTGVRLRDVLEKVGLKPDAVYVGYYGTDIHLSGDPGKSTISRGVPMRKALEDETLLAWAMNGADIPLMHGHPLRLVVGGWPASVSGKWLSRLSVRNIIHDGEKMGGDSYRVPAFPVEPGAKVAAADMKIIESMPVKSVITYPRSGAILELGDELPLRGHSWAGDLSVKEMMISIDYGATWQKCSLQNPKNRLAWQHWSASVRFPKKGYYEVWAKATDSEGTSQTMVMPAWNPKGYINNACHRIAIKVV
ncbi:sulfite oxidase [Arundinibacter roseus]|uniref:Molybdopterin containing oxidoreductase n=1 Tax=Arundinibacter roseus TaxID=2070510 RepID=A0A4R4KDN7_9BACT|nr:sulfite oxidase [Arundinibacter roseus]TDB66020.1 molybdopterin containing oxidoreductase [Arundinibacter roseus]